MPVEFKIRDYLKSNGITQKHLSDLSGISRPKISMAFKGKRKFSIEEYAAICWALDVGIDKFLNPEPLKTKSC